MNACLAQPILSSASSETPAPQYVMQPRDVHRGLNDLSWLCAGEVPEPADPDSEPCAWQRSADQHCSFPGDRAPRSAEMAPGPFLPLPADLPVHYPCLLWVQRNPGRCTPALTGSMRWRLGNLRPRRFFGFHCTPALRELCIHSTSCLSRLQPLLWLPHPRCEGAEPMSSHSGHDRNPGFRTLAARMMDWQKERCQ